jgi:hypothetical protein
MKANEVIGILPSMLRHVYVFPRGVMATFLVVAARRVTWVFFLLMVASPSGSLHCVGGDILRGTSPASRDGRNKVCFSQSSPPDAELPMISESGWPILTSWARRQLERPARTASFTDLDRFTDSDAELFARVPGTVAIGLAGELSVCSATHLGRHRGYLSIRLLRDMSDEVGRALGQHHGPLVLRDLRRVSNEALRGLARCDGELTIGIESLNPEQARILSRREQGLHLPRVATVDEQTAEILAHYPGPLQLVLAEANPSVARHLANRAGPLDLGGGLRLSGPTAKEIARYRGNLSIQQRNFAEPAEVVLAALSDHQAELMVVLDKPLTVGIARALCSHAGSVRVNVPPPFTRDAVVMLARTGHTAFLDVSSHAALGTDDLKALSHYQGSAMQLRLAGDLDEGACQALARYRGHLIIDDTPNNRIRASSLAVAALAAHYGRLSIPSTLVRDDTIESVCGHDGGLHIRYSGDDTPSVETSRKLAAVEGWLRVDGKLSAESLRALVDQRGELVLGRLPQEGEEVELLLRRKGKLYFPDNSEVKSIAAARLVASEAVVSDTNDTQYLLGADAVEIASALAGKQGPLSFPYLKYVTDDALRALVQKEDVELLPLDELYVFGKDGCIVPAEDVVPESFRTFNRTNQPPRSLSSQRRWYEQ